MVNSFFKNGDKAYSENLNDGVLVGNAFDWTVSISLPTDTGSVFPNSSSVVKAKVADCSITPNSNLSIGSTISNSSGSSQVYRLTVYPNFNRFGGFQSISVTGDATFYIANKGASTPIANNLDYTDLSDVPELKVLKEYDIVLTIANGKSVSGLEFVFQSSSADVSGIISQSCVDGLVGDITRIDAKDSEQDGRLTTAENNDVAFASSLASLENDLLFKEVSITGTLSGAITKLRVCTPLGLAHLYFSWTTAIDGSTTVPYSQIFPSQYLPLTQNTVRAHINGVRTATLYTNGDLRIDTDTTQQLTYIVNVFYLYKEKTQ